MPITALPSPPSRQEPSTFSAKTDAFLGALPTFVAEANTLGSQAATDAATATTQAGLAADQVTLAANQVTLAAGQVTLAETAALEAEASALTAINAPGTNATSTTSAAVGLGSLSITIQTGKAFVVGMHVMVADTAAPSTNYMHGQITAYDSGTGTLVVDVTSTLGSGTKTAWTVSLSSAGGVTINTPQTLTNKTLSNMILDGSMIEEVYVLAGTTLDPGNGTIQTKTIAANTTFTDSLAAGESMVLMLTGAASFTITWPTATWVSATGNVAPTLTANDVVVFWKIGTTLYGEWSGSYATV